MLLMTLRQKIIIPQNKVVGDRIVKLLHQKKNQHVRNAITYLLVKENLYYIMKRMVVNQFYVITVTSASLRLPPFELIF